MRLDGCNTADFTAAAEASTTTPRSRLDEVASLWPHTTPKRSRSTPAGCWASPYTRPISRARYPRSSSKRSVTRPSDRGRAFGRTNKECPLGRSYATRSGRTPHPAVNPAKGCERTYSSLPPSPRESTLLPQRTAFCTRARPRLRLRPVRSVRPPDHAPPEAGTYSVGRTRRRSVRRVAPAPAEAGAAHLGRAVRPPVPHPAHAKLRV